MKKILAFATLAFVLTAGTVMAPTIPTNAGRQRCSNC
jgi:hypothetical protein